MRNLFSKLTLMAALAVACLVADAPRAEAQTYGSTTLSAVPSGFGASVATNIGTVIDMRYNRNLGAFLQGASDATPGATPTLTAHFVTGLDGASFQTNGGVFDLTLTLVTTTTKTVTTNWDLGAIGWAKLLYITNASAGNITNCFMEFSTKPGS